MSTSTSSSSSSSLPSNSSSSSSVKTESEKITKSVDNDENSSSGSSSSSSSSKILEIGIAQKLERKPIAALDRVLSIIDVFAESILGFTLLSFMLEHISNLWYDVLLHTGVDLASAIGVILLFVPSFFIGFPFLIKPIAPYRNYFRIPICFFSWLVSVPLWEFRISVTVILWISLICIFFLFHTSIIYTDYCGCCCVGEGKFKLENFDPEEHSRLFSLYLIAKRRHNYFLYGILFGFLMMLTIRIPFFSINPPSFNPAFSVVLTILSLISLIFVEFRDFSDRKTIIEKTFLSFVNEDTEIPNALRPYGNSVSATIFEYLTAIIHGYNFGSLFFFGLFLFTSCNVIMRFSGMDVFPGEVAIPFFFFLGILLAMRPRLIIFIWPLGILGTGLLISDPNDSQYIGGLILALSFPSLLRLNSRGIFLLRTVGRLSTAFALFFFFFTVWLLTAIAVFFGGNVPLFGSSTFRKVENVIFPIWIIFILTAIIEVIRYAKFSDKFNTQGEEFSFWRLFESFYQFKKKPSLAVLFNLTVYLLLIGICSAITAGLYFSPRDLYNPNQYFTVMSYNVFQATNRNGLTNVQKVSDIVSDYEVDLAGFQESDSVHVFTLNHDIVEYVSTSLSLRQYYSIDTSEGSLGSAVVSTFNMRNEDFVILPANEETTLLRIVSRLTFTFNNTEISFFNVHVEFAPDSEVELQLNFLRDIINNQTGPLILVGDFNRKPDEFPFPNFINQTNLISAHPISPPENVTSTNDDGKIDYIFYRNLVLRSSQVIDDRSTSDHNPIIATFTTL